MSKFIVVNACHKPKEGEDEKTARTIINCEIIHEISSIGSLGNAQISKNAKTGIAVTSGKGLMGVEALITVTDTVEEIEAKMLAAGMLV